MSPITIVLFFVYCYGMGFTVSSFAKNSENFLERNLMRIGFGLSLIPFLAIALNAAKIPADWRIILILSMAYPLYCLFKHYREFNLSFKLTKANLSILFMIAIFSANFYIYGTGAFNYPYLEDDDSWSHAIGVKFFSIEKNAFDPKTENLHYINPYPPAYDALLGILHQTSSSIYWTLKFFNALIISLSTIFFYFFVKEFTGSGNKALFAAFALFSIPAFASHFIWAISLAMPLYFVSFYAIEMIKHDRKWWIPAAMAIATTLISSPTHSTYFGLFFALYLLTKMLLEKKILFYHALSGLTGLLLSAVFWWIPMIIRHGFEGALSGLGFQIGIAGGEGLGAALGGTGDRVYSFADFFIAQKQNMINNPIGIGIFLSLLAITSVAFLMLKFRDLPKEENHWLAVAFVWLVFTLYAVNAAKMPIRLSPFRAWMLLAIPVCILASDGISSLMSISKKSAGKTGMYAMLLLLLAGIYFTSAQQKIAVNTAVWPPGAFWTYAKDESGRVYSPELEGYIWMRENFPPNTNVFTFKNNGPVIGMDMYSCHWCEDVRGYMKNGFNQSANENYKWLKSKGYQYLIIDSQTVQDFGANKSNAKIQEIAQSGLFGMEFQNQGSIIFRI